MTEQQALFEELLIEEVHKYEHLWKVKSNNFKDMERANISWKEIASTIQSMGVTASDNACKKKWKYLRDSYARLKRECSSKSGGRRSSVNIKECPLEILSMFELSRRRDSNATNDSELHWWLRISRTRTPTKRR